MNRNIKIYINSLSFIIIILALLLIYIYFLDARHTFSIIGFSLALIYLEIKNKFWAYPLFIDSIEISKEIIKIKHINPMLKKGEIAFDSNEISNFRNIKKNIFTKNNRIEFDYKKIKTKFVYLNSEKEEIKKLEESISQNKSV
jgi:hypothetical protein